MFGTLRCPRCERKPTVLAIKIITVESLTNLRKISLVIYVHVIKGSREQWVLKLRASETMHFLLPIQPECLQTSTRAKISSHPACVQALG
jgi:hypothetical protein